jgi:hypothetical protein
MLADYDAQILHKTHVMVSDNVSDTDTSRILTDTGEISDISTDLNK